MRVSRLEIFSINSSAEYIVSRQECCKIRTTGRSSRRSIADVKVRTCVERSSRYRNGVRAIFYRFTWNLRYTGSPATRVTETKNEAHTDSRRSRRRRRYVIERSTAPHTPRKRNASNGVPLAASLGVVRRVARSATYRAPAGDAPIGAGGAAWANGVRHRSSAGEAARANRERRRSSAGESQLRSVPTIAITLPKRSIGSVLRILGRAKPSGKKCVYIRSPRFATRRLPSVA